MEDMINGVVMDTATDVAENVVEDTATSVATTAVEGASKGSFGKGFVSGLIAGLATCGIKMLWNKYQAKKALKLVEEPIDGEAEVVDEKDIKEV